MFEMTKDVPLATMSHNPKQYSMWNTSQVSPASEPKFISHSMPLSTRTGDVRQSSSLDSILGIIGVPLFLFIIVRELSSTLCLFAVCLGCDSHTSC